jgi:hypothetical protein
MGDDGPTIALMLALFINAAILRWRRDLPQERAPDVAEIGQARLLSPLLGLGIASTLLRWRCWRPASTRP